MSFKRKISRLNFGVGKMKGRDTYRWWRHRAVISTSISIPIPNARAPSGFVLFTRFVVHFSFRLYEETTPPRQFLNRCARLIAFPVPPFFRTLNQKIWKLNPQCCQSGFGFRIVSTSRWNRSRPPTAMIFRASALVCIVSASTKFWMRWWGITRGSSSRVGPSERMREREREALKEEKRKKNSCPFFSLSLSLSLSSFFSSLFFSLHSLFLSFFPKKWDEEIFWFFWPLLFGRRKEPGAIEEEKKKTTTYSRAQKHQNVNVKNKRRVTWKREEPSCVSSDRMPRARL